MAVSRPRWVALLWFVGMGSLALSLWASAILPGTITHASTATRSRSRSSIDASVMPTSRSLWLRGAAT